MVIINPDRKCHNPGCQKVAEGQTFYCSLRCRDRAKYLRRLEKQKQSDKAWEEHQPGKGADGIERIDYMCDEQLDFMVESIKVNPSMSPFHCKHVPKDCKWKAPAGFTWEILLNGDGKLEKI